jgi:2'-5' RNA ligase
MPEQLMLPGWDEPPVPSGRTRARARYKLFVALFPGPTQALAIAQLADHWHQLHALSAPRLAAERLHVTLQVLGDYVERPAHAVVDAAMSALATVDQPATRTCWDRLLSLPSNGALVLRCDASSDQVVARLRNAVQRALARQGLYAQPSSTPHMTLLYDRHHVAPQFIGPVCWTATEIALILSHLGKHHHQWLGRWPLASTNA